MYVRGRSIHLDAGSPAAPLSISTLLPLPRSRAEEPPPGLAFAPLALSARRPKAPLPTALDAFVVLQRAHQRRASTAFLHSTFVAKPALLSASTEAQAPMACVRENIFSFFV